MTLHCYYNDNNPFAAARLRELIAAGFLLAGDVDERDIRDVQASDLARYIQCHFFAGVGGWPYAARCAGWPADRQLWTGSCPCQPFSRAGRRRGSADARHLWPDFYRLISAARPAVIMGEQVAGSDGEIWIDRVCADLEKQAFAVRPIDLTAYAVGAPHERQRIYWVAERMGDADSAWELQPEGRVSGKRRRPLHAAETGRLEHDAGIGRREGWPELARRERQPSPPEPTVPSGVGNALREGWPISETIAGSLGRSDGRRTRHPAQRSDDTGFWHDAEDVWCEWDQKWRRAKPSIPMLVDGLPGRVHEFTLFGNAVVAPLVEECIRAYLEAEMIGAP